MAPLIVKEFRALFLTWSACVVAISLGFVPALRSADSLTVSLLAYVIGTIALGAQTVGHEYGYRTVGFLLSQPVERGRLLITKLGVLLPMVVALGALLWWMLLAQPLRPPSFYVAEIIVPPLAGLLLTPYITMVSRSQLAGTVFTIGILGNVWLVAGVWAAATYGINDRRVDNLAFSVATVVVVALCAAGAVLGWRTFMRLEAIDGTGAALNIRGWLRRTPARQRHPLMQLLRKELHIQQMTFVVVGIFLAAWIVMLFAKQRGVDLRDIPVAFLTMLYAALLSLLIGSLASAEERQFGTLQWQTLLPVPAWQQWSIKVGVTMVLTLLFGVALPLLLMRVSPSVDDKTFSSQMPLTTVALIICVTVSLYVSSISTSGVRALVLAIPAALALVVFVQVLAGVIFLTVPSLGPRGLNVVRVRGLNYDLFGAIVIALLVLGALLFLVLHFAAINHRLADRSVRRVVQQVAWVAGALTFVILMLHLVH
jgi:hypothetical protein